MKRITTVICMALLWILTVQAQIQELNVSKRFNWGIGRSQCAVSRHKTFDPGGNRSTNPIPNRV